MAPGPRHRRRFGLADAMVLIAASAVALAMTRSYMRCFPALHEFLSREPYNRGVMGTRERLHACVPPLVVLTAALLPLSLVRPQDRRPRRRLRLARSPGLTASSVSWVALTFALVRSLFDLSTSLRNTSFPGVGHLGLEGIFTLRVVGIKDSLGPAVALTWLLLWLGGRWRAEPTRVDRLGRLLGALWIAIGVASWIEVLIRR
ncbi:hypothetical protein [Aquisphaera insulae]|uniref:hypothetical protein n=1 Tax=Aquisphaera insulae TaxID=2712864 RepID=UPI0013EDDB96|nr:hypothetical protein [Aquisphaera insulae]